MLNISNELKVQQTQKLIITPELKQAITILHLPSLELMDFLQQELVNNPILELKEEYDLDSVELEDQDEELDWEEYFQDYPADNYESIKPGESSENNYENYVTGSMTLQEYLMNQLSFHDITPKDAYIAEFIIGSIDQNGYLKSSVDDLAMMLAVKSEDVQKVLSIIKTFDPIGVGAGSIEECLLQQLSEREKAPSYTQEIISNYLEQVASGQIKEISCKLKITISKVQNAVDIIKTLNPKPGSIFADNNSTKYVTPDVIVQKVNEEYVILVNDTIGPKLHINSYYQGLIKNKDNLASNFLKKRLDSALWLIRSIEQRRLTLFKVTEEIVRVQRGFLEEGIKKLRPMILKDIAKKLGIHESTVSRAVANKYVQIPRGLYPLKYFFTSGISSDNGNDFSSQTVKHYIKELINNENLKKPISDQKIALRLKDDGIIFSRRTVAKYREDINIPASNKRKRH